MARAPRPTLTPAEIQRRRDEYTRRLLDTFQLDPQVTLILKGTTYTLEFTNRSVKAILKACGFNVLKEGFNPEAMGDPTILGAVLWGGLLTHHPDLTLDDVDGLFTARHYPYIENRLRTALDLFLPDVSDLVDPEPEEVVLDTDPLPPATVNGSATGRLDGCSD